MWKPINEIKYYQCLPAFHWPYQRNYRTNTYKTAFIPLAIMIGLCLAFAGSMCDFWNNVVLRATDIKEKKLAATKSEISGEQFNPENQVK